MIWQLDIGIWDFFVFWCLELCIFNSFMALIFSETAPVKKWPLWGSDDNDCLMAQLIGLRCQVSGISTVET